MSHRHQLTSLEAIKTFVLGGKATFTLLNTDTGNRVTFKVQKPDDDKPHFVRTMTGPDNEGSYTFLGTMFDADTDRARYSKGRNSRIGDNAMSAKVFAWMFKELFLIGRELPSQVQFWHEGACCRCGRKLTVPASIESGIGPICAGLMN